MARWRNRFLWPALLLCLAYRPAALAQSNWRSFNNTADGLAARSATYLSLGAGGALWVRHDEEDRVSRFDGYSTHLIPAPASDALAWFGRFRVYEGESGQTWTLNTNGVQWFDGRIWRATVVPEIAEEWRSQVVRKVRQIPLLPAENYNVLVLLSEKLIKVDALTTRSTVIGESADIGLGRFGELVASAAGGYWVTAEEGVARVEGTTIQSGAEPGVVHPDAEWRAYRIPRTINARNPQRPFEDSQGGLMMLADQRSGDGRVWLRFNRGDWSTETLPLERMRQVRQVWRTRDGKAWALEVNALRQWHPPGIESREMSDIGIRPGPFSDVAIETGGAFWVSTPDGVWRYAPFSWRAPEQAPAIDETIFDVSEGTDHRIWFLGSEHLHLLADGRWMQFALPGRQDTTTGGPGALVELADGRWFLSGQDSLMTFDPSTARFAAVPFAEGATFSYLGKEGARLLFARSEASQSTPELVAFDGQEWREPGLPVPPVSIGQWTTMVAGEGGVLWAGGTAGAARWSGGQWRSFLVNEGTIPDGVELLLVQGTNTVWAGTRSGLLTFAGERWERVPGSFGRVHGLTAGGEGVVWAATESGLHHNKLGRWMTLGVEEGIGGDARVLRRSSDGRLWLGHSRGLSLFHPETDQDPPQTYLTDRPQNEQVSGRDLITFSFTGEDRWKATSTERLLFSYRLDGGPWNPPTPASTVQMPAQGLTVGQHLFEVRALDRHLNFDLSPAAWVFMVVRPWYLEPRMVGIVLLAAAAVIGFGALAVNRHLRLVRSYAEIERIVQERTRQLEATSRQLAHAEKMRSLGTLAAGVAHDFNSILSIIRGSVQIIEKHPENGEKIRTRISRIKSMVEQGSTLVKAMLGFSRADDVQLVLDDVGAVVGDTVRMLGDRLPAEVQVSVEVASGLPAVHGSRELLQQMLMNLMLNAIDAMDGGGRLMVRCQRAHSLPVQWIMAPAAASEYVGVWVEDSGCGITPENLSRICEPFFTTKAFSTRHGTGLGLSMVYEFSKELGYGLAVRSELQKGTTFIIVIPVYVAPVRGSNG